MKQVYLYLEFCVLFCFCIIKVGYADNKPVIQVIDSLVIDLSRMDSTICIDNSVVLSFDSDSIFACEWIDLANGNIISKEKTVTVSPETTRKYQVNLYYFTGELIQNGDFEDESQPEWERVITDYTFVKTVWNGWNKNVKEELWNEKTYRIGTNPRNFHPGFYRIGDYTSGTGNMMIVNGSEEGNTKVWEQTVNVEKGRIYAFSTWGVEIGRNNPAKFHFTINGIPLGKDFQLRDDGEANAKWEQFYELWEATETKARISLVNLNTEHDGNDFAIDDISFASMQKKTGIITVKVLPAVELGKLADIVKCEGEKIVVNARAHGTGITGYVWKKGNEVLAHTTSLLELPEAVLQDSGLYICSVTGECGTKENTFRIDVREKLKASKLRDTVWPCEEKPLMFSANVLGYKPVYQWTAPVASRGWKEDTEGNYSNASVRWYRDTGTYLCHVSNQCGSVDVYRVLEAGKHIEFTDWPPDQEVCIGSSLALQAGTDPKTEDIVWSGPGISGLEIGKEIILQNIGNGDAGVYYCNAVDACGKNISQSMILKVVTPMTLLKVYKDTVVCEGGRAVFRALTDGIKPVYHWSGPNHFTAETPEIVIDSVTAAKTGVYTLIVRDSCGKGLSAQVNLSLLKEYDSLKITEDQKICPGEGIKMEVTEGKEGILYEWTTPSGKLYSGASLLLNAGEEGVYLCRIKGICPGVEKSVTLKWYDKLQVETGENHFRICEGENVCFRPLVQKGENVDFHWWKEGQEIGRGPEWCISKVKAADAGEYDCRIHSLCGDTVLSYRLDLKEPVRINGYLPDRYVRPREKTFLFVSATGEDLVYEWEREGILLKGENDSRLDIEAAGTEKVVEYICRVSGCTTEVVVIRVHVRDYINLIRDTTVVLCPGQHYSYRADVRTGEGCDQKVSRQYWIYNKKDTVAYGAALDFPVFREDQIGEYVYTQESDCGKEQLHLRVASAGQPLIMAIHCTQSVDEERGNITVCSGEDVVLEAEVEANGLLTYEWSRNGVLIPGQNGPALVLKNVSLLQEGRYACRAVSAVCGEDTREIVLKVNKKLSVISMDDLILCPGQEAKLQIYADASTPSEFIWEGPKREGWTARSDDGYTAVYRNPAVGADCDGIYTCQVSNACGKEVVNIRLQVEQRMDTLYVFKEDTICSGADTKLYIHTKHPDVKYSWILPDNGVVEGDYVSVKNFSVSDAGVYRYHVETKNRCFSRDGNVRLTMRKELDIPRVTPDTAVCKGFEIWLQAYVAGTGVQYEWWGPQGFKANGEKVQVDPVTELSSGIYEIVATDVCNKVGRRNRIKLSLLKEFDNLSINRDTGVCIGSNVRFDVTGGVEGLTYEWLFGGRSVAVESGILIAGATEENAGLYTCRVSGRCQQMEERVNLEVYRHLRAKKLAFLPVCERENANLKVEATGEQVKYKWLKEGEEVGYQTENLDLNDAIPSDAGIYECQVTSLCGDTTLQYEFRLKEKTRITRHSVDRILCEDDDYDLFVEVAGENNQYRWKCQGKFLPEENSLLHQSAIGHTDTLLYTCYVTGDCGRDSVSIQIAIGAFRKVRENREDVLCEGSNYKYNADVVPLGAFEGQGFNYQWTFNSQLVSNQSLLSFTEVRPEDAGDYYCTVTTLPGAPVALNATVKLTVRVTRLPQLKTISGDIYAIEGSKDSIKVETTGDDLSYSWMKDGEMTEHTEADWYFTPLVYEDRGNYKITVSNGCGSISGVTNVEVWRKTMIVYPLEREDSVCLNSNVQLDVLAWGESGLLYKWYLNHQLVDAPFTQPLKLEQAGWEDQGTYICVVSGRGGTDSCKVHLKVMTLPEVMMTGKFSICREDSELLQKYTGSCRNEERVSYLWSVDGGEARDGVNWEKATIYWDKERENILKLKITSLSSGCSVVKSENVIWNDLPEVRIVVPAEVGFCQDSLKLERAYPWGGGFYIDGLLGKTVRFTDKSAVYRLDYQYTDGETGCSNSVQDSIRIADAPLLRLAEDTVISGWCVPVSLEVEEHSEGEVLWKGDRPLEMMGSYKVQYHPLAYVEGELRFQAILTDKYTCQASDSAVVILLPSPKVELMQDTVVGICNELVLKGTYDTALLQKIKWEPAGSVNVLDTGEAEMVEKLPGENLFFLSVTDSYGCIGKDTMKVVVIPAPQPENREICFGDSIVVETGQYSAYTWSDGYTGKQRVLKEPGEYRLDVEDENGCHGEVVYRVHALPIVELPDTLIFEGQQMIYEVEANGIFPPYDILWQDGSGGSSCIAEKEGNYQVTVSDNIGCSVTDTAFLEVRKEYIAAPDAFLPNSGGENSRFYLKEVNFVDRFEMYIYDRWGELLFKTQEIGFKGGWDGTFKGISCQPGAYVWVAYVNGKEIAKGTVMLIR